MVIFHGYVSHNQMVYVMYFLFESPISSCQRTQPPKKKSRTRPWPALRLCQLCQRRTSPLKTRFFFTRTGNLTRNQYGYTHTYLYIYNTYMYAHVHIYIFICVCVILSYFICLFLKSIRVPRTGLPRKGD
jgi:hypothetical protein